MYILAIHLTSLIFDILINIRSIPRGSEKTSVRTNIIRVASIPLASFPTTSAKSLINPDVFLSAVISLTLLSVLKHMLSSSPQSLAISSNVPSASISYNVSWTISLNSVLPGLKPIPYCSFDTCSDSILNWLPLASSSYFATPISIHIASTEPDSRFINAAL